MTMFSGILWLLLVQALGHVVAFGSQHRKAHAFHSSSLSQSQSDLTQKDLREEADELLSRARKLREEIGATSNKVQESRREEDDILLRNKQSLWSVKNEDHGDEYRLYVDIGRGEGSWMDRRWGASGRRIPFTIDVKFLMSSASTSSGAKMVKDNFMGESSESFNIATAGSARLRGGFDQMNCAGGSYRIDSAKGKNTVRFYLEVEGTGERQDYGDISVPSGCLYFSLPCFGGKTSQLSTKEGIVTVRQAGWNTGWRRDESRIVGTFYARPIESARQRDGF